MLSLFFSQNIYELTESNSRTFSIIIQKVIYLLKKESEHIWWLFTGQPAKAVLDLNEARDDAVAVALAVLYANHLYLTPWVNHVSTSSLNFSQTGCYTWCLTVSKLLEGRLRSRQNYTNSALAGNFFCKDYKRQTANNLIEIWQTDIRTLL